MTNLKLNFLDLPPDLQLQVLSSVRPPERLLLPQVCRGWAQLAAGSSPLWSSVELHRKGDKRLDYFKVVRCLHDHGAAIRNIVLCPCWPRHSGSGAGLFAMLPNLRSLTMHSWRSRLLEDGQLSCLLHITGLRKLALQLEGAQHLSTEVLEPIGRLPALKSLKITTSSHQLLLPSSFSALNQLSNLRLHHEVENLELDQEGAMKVVQYMTGLKRLEMLQQVNQISTAFSSLTALSYLSLESFDWTAPSFGSLDSLLSCPLSCLQLFDLPEACHGDMGAILQSLTKLPKLVSLDLSYQHFTDVRPDVWTFGRHITSLHLSYCRLLYIPPALVAMTSLVDLDIIGNWPAHLPSGPYLQRLEHLCMDILSRAIPPTPLLEAQFLRKLKLGEPDDGSLDGQWDLNALHSQLAEKLPACVLSYNDLPLASWLHI